MSTKQAASGAVLAGIAKPLSFLEIFYELANADPSRRVHAASELVRQLSGSPSVAASDGEGSEGFPGCSKELGYALKRLVRGLLSSREAARQGFALGLYNLLQTPVLRSVINVDVLFQRVIEETAIAANAKRQDVRESYFANIVFYTALHRAGVLYEPNVIAAHLTQTVQRMVEMATKKPYLREICFELLAQIANTVPRDALDNMILPAVSPFFQKDAIITPESLSFSLSIRERLLDNTPNVESATQEITNARQFCANVRVQDCADALKRSSAVFPRIHSVWYRIFGIPSPALSLKKMPTDDDMQVHEHIWTHIVDSKLLTSTHERQYLGFELFKLLIAAPQFSKRGAEDRLFLLSPNLLRCMHNSLKSKKNYLFKPAGDVLSVLETQPAMIRLGAATTLFSCLRNQPDKNILGRLLTGLSTTEADGFVRTLQDRFQNTLSMKPHVPDSDLMPAVSETDSNIANDVATKSKSTPAVSTATRRPFLVDALLASVRPGSSLPCSQQIKLDVFDFLFAHSFLDLDQDERSKDASSFTLATASTAIDKGTSNKVKRRKKGKKKSSKIHQMSIGIPIKAAPVPLREADRLSCQKNFFDLVHNLGHQSAAVATSQTVTTGTAKAKKNESNSQNMDSSAVGDKRRSVDMDASLDSLHKYQERIDIILQQNEGSIDFVFEWTDEDVEIRQHALALSKAMQVKRHANLANSHKSPDGPATPEAKKSAAETIAWRGIEGLILNMCFAHFESPAEIGENLRELMLCVRQIRSHQDRQKAMTVFTDLLLAMLSSPSQRLRQAVNTAWKDICWLATAENARALAKVLASTADELFGNQGNQDESDSEFEELSEEMEFGNEGLPAKRGRLSHGSSADHDSVESDDDDELSLDIDEEALDAITSGPSMVAALHQHDEITRDADAVDNSSSGANILAGKEAGNSKDSNDDSDDDSDDDSGESDEKQDLDESNDLDENEDKSQQNVDIARETEINEEQDARIEEEALAAIVRLRKEKAGRAQAVRQQTVHFKHRVLDLLDTMITQRGIDCASTPALTALVTALIRSAVGSSLIKSQKGRRKRNNRTPGRRKQANFSEAANLHKRIAQLVLKKIPSAKRKHGLLPPTVDSDSNKTQRRTDPAEDEDANNDELVADHIEDDEDNDTTDPAEIVTRQVESLRRILFLPHGPSLQALTPAEVGRIATTALISLLKFVFPSTTTTDHTVKRSKGAHGKKHPAKTLDEIFRAGLTANEQLRDRMQAFSDAVMHECFCRKNPRIATSYFMDFVQKFPRCSWLLFPKRLLQILQVEASADISTENKTGSLLLADKQEKSNAAHKSKKRNKKKKNKREREAAAKAAAEAAAKAEMETKEAAMKPTPLVCPKSPFQRCEILGVISTLCKHKVTVSDAQTRLECSTMLTQMAQAFSSSLAVGTGIKSHPMNKAKRLKELARFGRVILSTADRLSATTTAGIDEQPSNPSASQLVKHLNAAISRFIAASCSPSPAIERLLIELTKWCTKGITSRISNKSGSTNRVPSDSKVTSSPTLTKRKKNKKKNVKKAKNSGSDSKKANKKKRKKCN